MQWFLVCKFNASQTKFFKWCFSVNIFFGFLLLFINYFRNTTISSLVIGNNSQIVIMNSNFSNLNFSSSNSFFLMGDVNMSNSSTLVLFQNLTFINITCTKGSKNPFLFQSLSMFVQLVIIDFSILNSNFSQGELLK